ncbi:hypothetical protein NDU88_001236 [Pleurodeles waltl]|uniref:Uncharacterized protein n=1 Tax=Pleurodeles waltl TaxID=8319 RepID=A0AAV7SZY4_PLEWA|nr:hypothetical protein NDU88_001236 [Pleurodeles waltl]
MAIAPPMFCAMPPEAADPFTAVELPCTAVWPGLSATGIRPTSVTTMDGNVPIVLGDCLLPAQKNLGPGSDPLVLLPKDLRPVSLAPLGHPLYTYITPPYSYHAQGLLWDGWKASLASQSVPQARLAAAPLTMRGPGLWHPS